MNMGTASGHCQVTGPKIAGPPAFTPASSDSKNLQPLPQLPLPQMLQEPTPRNWTILRVTTSLQMYFRYLIASKSTKTQGRIRM